MKRSLVQRCTWLAATAGIVLALLWLDQHRSGPASMLSRCNLLLSRSDAPAAEILIVGSSRAGTALDPVGMQEMLAHAFDGVPPTVERLALGRNPLRASVALLENYLDGRGPPRVVALEIMFTTPRNIDRLVQLDVDLPPEQYIFRRDINLMTFGQILSMPAVAMPFSEGEGTANRWRYRLRGAMLRAGALTYEFLRSPLQSWNLTSCDRAAWTREPEWPADFSFSYGDVESNGSPDAIVDRMEASMADIAEQRRLKDWQVGTPTGQRYPYDVESGYRAGELALLRSMLDLAASYNVTVILLPLPLYGHVPGADDLRALERVLPAQARVFDVYGQIGGELGKFWYDDAHLEANPAGALGTALLAQYLLNTGLLTADDAGPAHD